jgi:hypothetical protein
MKSPPSGMHYVVCSAQTAAGPAAVDGGGCQCDRMRTDWWIAGFRLFDVGDADDFTMNLVE